MIFLDINKISEILSFEMTDPTVKYVLLALVPILTALLSVLFAYLAIRFKLQGAIDFINGFFWELKECFIYGINRGKILGERVFLFKNSVELIDKYLLYGASNAFGVL